MARGLAARKNPTHALSGPELCTLGSRGIRRSRQRQALYPAPLREKNAIHRINEMNEGPCILSGKLTIKKKQKKIEFVARGSLYSCVVRKRISADEILKQNETGIFIGCEENCAEDSRSGNSIGELRENLSSLSRSEVAGFAEITYSLAIAFISHYLLQFPDGVEWGVV